jgi:serine/threonine protein kinase
MQAMQLEQQQQGSAAGVQQQHWEDDDRALKLAHRYAERDLAYQLNYTYECHNTYHWQVLQDENMTSTAARSPFIIQCYGAGVVSCPNAEQLPCMLMELAKMGSLSAHVYGGSRKGLPGAEAQQLMKGIVRGLASLHVNAFRFHRDLKCGNILLAGMPGNLVPKVSDFGSCAPTTMPTQVTAPMTPAFRAPEQQHGMFQDQRLDTFLLALLWLEMRFGFLPFAYHGHTVYTVNFPPLQPSQYLGELSNPYSLYNLDDPATGRTRLTGEEKEFLVMCLAPDVAVRYPVSTLLATSTYLA